MIRWIIGSTITMRVKSVLIESQQQSIICDSVYSPNNSDCPCWSSNKQIQGLSDDKSIGVLPGGEVKICQLTECPCICLFAGFNTDLYFYIAGYLCTWCSPCDCLLGSRCLFGSVAAASAARWLVYKRSVFLHTWLHVSWVLLKRQIFWMRAGIFLAQARETAV